MDTRDAIKAKIARLMAMGTHERSNQFEAEAALRQAAALMRKHAIEQSELADATGTGPRFDWITVDVAPDPKGNTKTAVLWIGTLAVSIAGFTDVKALWAGHPQRGMTVRFQGEATDVHYAVWLLEHLARCVRHDAGAYVGTRRERESFRRAMVARIGQRMKEIKQQQREDMRASVSESRALVLVDRKIALRDEQFGAMKVHERRSRRPADLHAMLAGQVAGERVGFGRPVTHAAEQ